jgi:Domain of unknown function (DUF4349)
MTSYQRPGRRAAAVPALLLGAALLAGCGAQSAASRSAAAQAQAPAPPAPYGGSDAGGAGAPAAPDAAASGGAAQNADADLGATDGRSLIITAALEIDVPDVDAAVQRAVSATGADGGYVADESVGDGAQPVPDPQDAPGGADPVAPPAFPAPATAVADRQAVLVLRVVPDRVDALLAQLSGSGKVAYQTRDSADVTTQVADVDSRVASARDSIAELRSLMNRATGISDLTTLENSLSQQESDLESLEAQQKALGDEVGMATVTVEMVTPVKGRLAPAPAHHGLLSGLKSGWHALTAGVRAVLIAVGWTLPFAVLAALVWFPVRRLRSRRGGRGPVSVAAAGGPAGPEPGGE